jgi:predicted HTH domain antitoxin
MSLTIVIPDSALASLQLPPEQLRRELQEDLAVILYARGALPVGKAMELAGVTRREFEALLKARNVERPFEDSELDRELR